MLAMRRTSALALACCLSACSSAQKTEDTPVVATMSAAPAPSASVEAEVVPAVSPTNEVEAVTFYPVIRIFSLMDLWRLEDGSLEIRLGYDPGGGMRGEYRFAPIVRGVPDLEQETDSMTNADTTFQGRIELIGTRPSLIYHSVSGFRSGPMDGYAVLGEDGTWTKFTEPAGRTPGIGLGVFAWSEERLLELRMEPSVEGPQVGDQSPGFRVFRGKNKAVPAMPKALTKRLMDEGFALASHTVLRSGEVVMVGRLPQGGTGTLLWRSDLKNPEYFVASDLTVGREESDVLSLLGGDTLGELRLQANRKVMKLDGSRWVLAEELAEGALPNIWFGKPLIYYRDRDAYVRFASDQPFKLLHKYKEGQEVWPDFAFDKDGTLWKAEGDQLSSTKAPVEKLPDVTDEALVAARKRSITRGGSYDAPTDRMMGSTKCSKFYLPLHKAKAGKVDAAAYGAFRKALDENPKLRGTELMVSEERGVQFLGVSGATWEALNEIQTFLTKKKVKGLASELVICADPPAVRRL